MAGFEVRFQEERWIEQVVAVALRASKEILRYYRDTDLAVETKPDATPVTLADLAAHRSILADLEELTPGVPVVSEESSPRPWVERRSWSSYWLVDPLDGTREFIDRNDEFCVNLALMIDGRPRFGIVHMPVDSTSYIGFNADPGRAFRLDAGGTSCPLRVAPVRLGGPITMLTSRRVGSGEVEKLRGRLEADFETVNLVPMGSARKICLVAEGKADLYARFGPTSEWDTAAGHAVLEAAGGMLVDRSLAPLRYGQRGDLVNPDFCALGDRSAPWARWLTQG